MIAMGAGTNHWFHSDQIYRTFFTLLDAVRLPGRQRRRLGALRRPGEGAAADRLAARWRSRWTGGGRPRHMTGTSFFYLHTDQWRYEGFGAAELASPLGRGPVRGQRVRRRARPGGADGVDALAPDVRPQPARPRRRGRRGRQRPSADHVVDELKAGRLRFAGDDPDDPANFPRVITVWRANLLGSSGKGMEYFMRHLLGADDAVRAEESPGPLRARRGAPGATDAPRGKLDLLITIDFRMTSTCTYSDIVLPAATWYEKHDISTTDMHPFVHSFNPAIAPPWETRTDFDAFAAIAARVLPARRGPPGHAHRRARRPADARHAGRARPARRAGAGLEARRVRSGARRDDAAAGRRRARLRRGGGEDGRARAAGRDARHHRQGRHRGSPPRRWTTCAGANGAVRGGVADGRPALARDIHLAEAILALSGTTNGEVAVQGWRALEERTGVRAGRPGRGARGRAHHLRRHPGPAARGDHLAGMVRQRDRRAALLAVHGQRRTQKPWHTLTGRMHFFLDHDWIAEYGEALPAYRPPLDYARHFGDAGAGRGRPPGDHGALPDPAFEVVDPLRVPGQPAHAAAVPRRAGDLDEPAPTRRGSGSPTTTGSRRTTATAWSPAGPWSPTGCPQGTVFMYHAKDRHLMTPEVGDLRLARRRRQLADPAGDQADAHDRRLRPAVLRVQLLRAHRQPARRDHRDPPPRPGGGVLMRVMAPDVAMVMNLDKCIGCHTCSVTCKQVWTNRPGTEYVYFNNVETKPGVGYPRRYEDQEQWHGGWTLDRKGRLQLKAGGRLRKLLSHLLQPRPAHDRRLRRPVDLRLPDADQRARWARRTRARTRSPR